LTGNQWNCDCVIKWLKDDYSAQISGGVCSTPVNESSNTLGSGGTWVPDPACDFTTTTAATTTSNLQFLFVHHRFAKAATTF